MNAQAIILAGGSSSRFFPFNQVHKTLFSLGGMPILARTIQKVAESGITDIIVVVGPNSTVAETVKPWIPDSVKVTFKVQPEPLGQANAILAAEADISSPFFVINAQNWQVGRHFQPMLDQLAAGSFEAILVRTQTNNPNKYGMLALDGDRVTQVVEKPSLEDTPSNWRIVGTYLFQPSFLDTLKQTPLDYYQLEAALNTIAKNGHVSSIAIPHSDPTLKYPWDLFQIKDEILSEIKDFQAEDCFIAETATIRGPVHIASGVQIHDYAIIEGPAYIGENALVGAYSIVRNRTVLEAGAQVERYCDVRNSIIGADTHIHSQFIGDSILGSHGRIGAGFITANKRIDRKNIQVSVKGELVDCGQNNLGVIMGDNAQIGIRVSTMPGTVLGNQVKIGPHVAIKGFFEDDSVIRQSNLV